MVIIITMVVIIILIMLMVLVICEFSFEWGFVLRVVCFLLCLFFLVVFRG